MIDRLSLPQMFAGLVPEGKRTQGAWSPNSVASPLIWTCCSSEKQKFAVLAELVHQSYTEFHVLVEHAAIWLLITSRDGGSMAN